MFKQVSINYNIEQLKILGLYPNKVYFVIKTCLQHKIVAMKTV